MSETERVDNELIDAGKFFTDAFWAGKSGGDRSLNSFQKKSLEKSQTKEFRRRYGFKLSKKKSELILAKNSNGEIMGCTGLEVDLISDPNDQRDGFQAPLMSNVAVGRKFRRRGVAEELVKKAEEVASDWGYNELYLLVEKRNNPAVKLYSKAGYRRIWEDTQAKTLVPSQGDVVTESTVILCMRKKLGGGIFANLFAF